MRHEYTIFGKGPEWAWNVLSAMLGAANPDSFRAYFRGYQSANRYWDAPDGLRYWRGRFEIDRGQADDAGLRRVDAGGSRAEEWAGPLHAPDGIGLYEQDERGRWWPTQAALAAGYLPCRSCEQTGRKAAIAATPRDPIGAAALIAAAQERSKTERGRGLDRSELADLVRQHPDQARSASTRVGDLRDVRPSKPVESSVARVHATSSDTNVVAKAHVVRRLLELRAREAPLGSSAYRGVLTQKAIAEIAGVPVREVTRAAIDLERDLETPRT
jgi:hypothetical protein